MGCVVVETFFESNGALRVATARAGCADDAASALPVAFERTTDDRFIACLSDGSGDAGDGITASRVAARHAAGECARSRASVPESIACALVSAHERVTDRATGERGAACSAVLVVIEIHTGTLHVGWAGALEAIVLRRGEVVHRTAPHFFAPELVAVASGRAPGVDLAGPWLTQPGDLLLLCSAKVHHALSEADVSALASRDDLAVIVRGLVTTTATRGDFAELHAVAIRLNA